MYIVIHLRLANLMTLYIDRNYFNLQLYFILSGHDLDNPYSFFAGGQLSAGVTFS